MNRHLHRFCLMSLLTACASTPAPRASTGTVERPGDLSRSRNVRLEVSQDSWNDPDEGHVSPEATTASASRTLGSKPAAKPEEAKPKREFPPPRPEAIALAGQETGPFGEALRRGDAAYLRGALDEADRAYGAARALRLNHGAASVGILRNRLARWKLPLDYGAAKGHKGLAALAKELEPWTKEDKLDGSPKRGTGSRSETAKSFPPAWVELGRVYLLLGEGPKALEAAQRGAELLPDEPEAQSALGVAWMATGHVPEASKALQKAVELDPGNAVRRGNWGTVLLLQGQVAEALEQYEIQVELAPSDPFAHGDLGTSLLALGDPSQFVRATQELERAVALEPNRATFRTNLGYAYTLQKRNTEALASHREAVRLDPNLASAWINLATVLATDPASRLEARKALERARVLDPTDPRLKPNFEELDALEGRPKAGVR